MPLLVRFASSLPTFSVQLDLPFASLGCPATGAGACEVSAAAIQMAGHSNFSNCCCGGSMAGVQATAQIASNPFQILCSSHLLSILLAIRIGSGHAAVFSKVMSQAAEVSKVKSPAAEVIKVVSQAVQC